MRILHDAVLVRILAETELPSGILISQRTAENAPTMTAAVLEMGNGEEVAKCGLKLGDKVLVYAGARKHYPLIPNKKDEMIVPHEAILSVLEAGD